MKNKPLAQRVRSCLQEKRFPSKVDFINKFFYRLSLKKDLIFYSRRGKSPPKGKKKGSLCFRGRKGRKILFGEVFESN